MIGSVSGRRIRTPFSDGGAGGARARRSPSRAGRTCATRIRLWLQAADLARSHRMKRTLLDRLVAERAAKHPVALVTEIPGGGQALVTEGGTEGELALDGAALNEIRPMLSRDKSGILEVEGRRLFVQCHTPPPRLMIVGAVHIAAPAPMASLAGCGVGHRSAPGLRLGRTLPERHRLYRLAG